MAGRKLTREERIEREAEALYALNMCDFSTACDRRWVDAIERDRHAYRKLATRVIDQQDEREGPLVKALETIKVCGAPASAERAKTALAEYDALDAAPERTLAEVAVDVLNDYHSDSKSSVRELRVVLLDELRAALEREKGGR